MRNFITIYASEASACIGMNKFISINDITKKIWERSCFNTYKGAFQRYQKKRENAIQQEIDYIDLNEKLGKPSTTTSHIHYINASDHYLIDLKDDLYDGDAMNKKHIDKMRSKIFTQKGILSEENSLNKLEKELDTKITERNARFYKQFITYETEDGTTDKFAIGGKIDGVTSERKIVEVKNRQYRIFDTIPEYEKVQIHIYMFLTGISECHVVQSFGEKTKQDILEFDPWFFDTLKTSIISYVKKLKNLMSDESLQDDLIENDIFR